MPNGDKGVEVAERGPDTGEEPGSYVAFRSAGEAVKGEFHCSECGYGVTVYRELPVCPMCAGTTWEQVAWSPLTRAGSVEVSAGSRPSAR